MVGPSPSGHATIEQGKYCSSYPDSFFMFHSPMHKLTRSVPQPVTPYLQEDTLRDWGKKNRYAYRISVINKLGGSFSNTSIDFMFWIKV